MNPESPNPDIKDYRPKLSAMTRDSLMELANGLAFVIEQPGRFDGYPSVPALLDSLAAAYRRNPAGVKAAMRELGVFWQPSPEDAD